MTDKAISPLRRRMIEDMSIRKFAPKTQASYIRAVRNFTLFLGRSPDGASAEDLRRLVLALRIAHPKVVAECEWNASIRASKEQRARNMRLSGVH